MFKMILALGLSALVLGAWWLVDAGPPARPPSLQAAAARQASDSPAAPTVDAPADDPMPMQERNLAAGEQAVVRCPEGALKVMTLASGSIELRCEAVAVPPPGPPTATALPSPTLPPPPPSPPPPSGSSVGIWIGPDEVRALPASGAAWQALRAAADGAAGRPTLCDQDSGNNVAVLAQALVYARTGEARYRDAVRSQVMQAMGTERGSCRALALGRELAAYVIAADLVGLAPEEEARFRSWLGPLRNQRLGDGRSLLSCHEERPNNWGTMCGASRIAASAYLGDRADLARAAAVFRGWTGDRGSYSGFSFGSLSWQADERQPRGVNPAGARKQGADIDGALPDDMRRGGGFTSGCPSHTGYAWEALQGALVQAELLHRQGFDAWGWESQAMRRAADYLYRLDGRCGGWWAEGDDKFSPWLINHAYGTDYPAASPAGSGKVMGWTDWTHDRATRPR